MRPKPLKMNDFDGKQTLNLFLHVFCLWCHMYQYQPQAASNVIGGENITYGLRKWRAMEDHQDKSYPRAQDIIPPASIKQAGGQQRTTGSLPPAPGAKQKSNQRHYYAALYFEIF